MCVGKERITAFGVDYKRVTIDATVREEDPSFGPRPDPDAVIQITSTTKRGDGVPLQNVTKKGTLNKGGVQTSFAAVYPAADAFTFKHRSTFTVENAFEDTIKRSFRF